MSANYSKAIDEDFRLVILQALAAQSDGRANETILEATAYSCGHNKSRGYLRTQLNKLEELGATINTVVGDDLVVAQITEAGVDHCMRRTKIEGIRQPRLGA